MNVFNGTNKFAGYFQAFSGGKAAVKIKRANDASDAVTIDEGFMVNSYTIQAGRGLVINRFLNMDGAVAQVGNLTGTLQLQGLVGTVSGFKKLLGGDSGNSDVCNQLVVTITASGGYTKCTETGEEIKVNSDAQFVIAGGFVSGFSLSGQIDQAGVMTQTGSVSMQFTQLEIK